jgi:hypothetical protein
MSQTATRDQIIKKIVTLFTKNVRGRSSDTSRSNQNHDGKDGHWLETQMGITHNGNNAPDIFGFEMKNHTSTKTTFGDWSPDYAVYKKKVNLMSRDTFLRTFGAPNVKKENRYSWSGKPCPKINTFNSFGQKLEVDSNNNILVIYSFKEDKRSDKKSIIPKDFQKGPVVIVSWSAELMKKRVEKKFNNLGWFKCTKNTEGVYTNIVFGNPITFDNWIKGVKKGLVYFDSGMYQGNVRPYSQWRADNKYWDSLIVEKH